MKRNSKVKATEILNVNIIKNKKPCYAFVTIKKLNTNKYI